MHKFGALFIQCYFVLHGVGMFASRSHNSLNMFLMTKKEARIAIS